MTHAQIVGTAEDQRPEPPAAFPDQWTTTSWMWSEGTRKWLPFTYGSLDTQREADKQAQSLVERGHRNIRIVRIPGDAQ